MKKSQEMVQSLICPRLWISAASLLMYLQCWAVYLHIGLVFTYLVVEDSSIGISFTKEAETQRVS